MPQGSVIRPVSHAGVVRRGRLLPLVTASLLLAVAWPVLTDGLPPLADYVNHLARMHVIAGIDADPLLARFYEIHWAVIPNLVMDLVVPPLTRVLDVYVAGQIFLLATVVLMVTGPMAVQRALYGRLSPWPLVAFPFAYNGILLYGLMNYLFGTGLAVWGLAGWIALREGPAWRRGLLSAAMVLALFACHLFAVGVYGMALLAYELWRAWPEGRAWPRLRPADALAFALPFLPVIPLMLASPTLGLSSENIWESSGKLQGLFTVVQTYWDAFDLAVAALMAGLVVSAAGRGLLRMHPAGWVLLAVSAAVYLAMPRMLFGSWMADQRLPIAVLFLALGFVRFEGRDRALRLAFYAIVLGLTLVRVVDVQVNWQRLRAIDLDFKESVGLIEPGAVVLVAHADHPGGDEITNAGLSHAPCIAMIERQALVSTAFTVQGKQVLDVRPDFRDRVDALDGDPPTVRRLLASADGTAPDQRPAYWDAWPDRYDYLYILYTSGQPNPDPDRLTLLHDGGRFQLYRIEKPVETEEDGTWE